MTDGAKIAAAPAPVTTASGPSGMTDGELLDRIVLPIVRERSREVGDAWDQATHALEAAIRAYRALTPAPSRAEVLEEALSEIKSMVTGDAYPAWGNMWETTVARGRILDIIDRALGEKP